MVSSQVRDVRAMDAPEPVMHTARDCCFACMHCALGSDSCGSGSCREASYRNSGIRQLQGSMHHAMPRDPDSISARCPTPNPPGLCQCLVLHDQPSYPLPVPVAPPSWPHPQLSIIEEAHQAVHLVVLPQARQIRVEGSSYPPAASRVLLSGAVAQPQGARNHCHLRMWLLWRMAAAAG